MLLKILFGAIWGLIIGYCVGLLLTCTIEDCEHVRGVQYSLWALSGLMGGLIGGATGAIFRRTNRTVIITFHSLIGGVIGGVIGWAIGFVFFIIFFLWALRFE